VTKVAHNGPQVGPHSGCQRSRDIGNYVVALKLLIFLGKWTHAHQNCTPWSAGRSASTICSRSKVTIWGQFTCSKCCSHLVHSFICIRQRAAQFAPFGA